MSGKHVMVSKLTLLIML